LSHTEDPADAAARLQLALDRIARLASRPAAPPGGVPPAMAPAQTAAIAARLDMLIAQLRAALANSP
jgi:hypothetical protein